MNVELKEKIRRDDLFEEDRKKGYVTSKQDITTCPNCGSKNISDKYVDCLCCRTYEGDGSTCWTAPYCNDCGFIGVGNSDGGLWFKWWK